MANTIDIDYLTRDFDGALESLTNFAVVNFSNRVWSDFNVNNFGSAVLDLVSYVSDVQSYYLDRRSEEAFIKTAKEDQSVLDIAGQLGYFPEDASVASGQVTFTITGAASIPQKFRVSKSGGNSPIYYTTQSASVTQAQYDLGTNTITLAIKQGDPKTDTFVANGLQSERFPLSNFPLIKESLTVIVGGDTYTRVNTFIYSKPNSKHFRIYYNKSNIATVEFGDGLFGRKLTVGQVVTLNYDIGGGTEGNAEVGEVEVLADFSTNVVSVTNQAIVTGATESKTKEEIAELAPNSVESKVLASLNDWKQNILANVSSVAKVSVIKTPISSNIFDLDVYAVPQGSEISNITTNLPILNEVREYVELRKFITARADIRDALTTPIDFEIEAYINSSFFVTEVLENINAAIEDLLSFENVDFGTNFLLNDLYNILDTIDGLDRYEVKKLSVDPQVRSRRDNYTETGNPTISTLLAINANGTSTISVVSNSGLSIGDKVQLLTSQRHNLVRQITNISGNIITLDGIVPNYYSILNGAKLIKKDGPYFSPIETFKNSEESKWHIENVTATTFRVYKDLFGNVSALTSNSLTDDGINFEVDSGISTSTASGFLADTSQCMVPNEFQSYLLVDSYGSVFEITGNSSEDFTLSVPSLDVSAISTPAAGAYSVVENMSGKNLILGNTEVQILYNTKNSIVAITTTLDQSGILGSPYSIRTLQSNTGTYGTKYFSDDNEVSFLVSESNLASQGDPNFDSYDFTITNRADDITILENNEIPILGRVKLDPRGGL